MALIPLNTFKTKTTLLTTATGITATVYTAPVGITSIVLMAQVSNISTVTQTFSFIHHRNLPILPDAQGNGEQKANTDSILVKNFEVPAGDAANPLSGKMIVETLDSIRAYSSSTGTMQLVMSILESANQ